MRWGYAEQKHHLIQSPDFSAGRIAANRPPIRFAFDEYRRVFATQVELVNLFLFVSNLHSKVRLKQNTCLIEKQTGGLFKFSAGVSVALRVNTLVVIFHLFTFLQSAARPYWTGQGAGAPRSFAAWSGQ